MSNEEQIKSTDAEYFNTPGPMIINFTDRNGVLTGTLTLSDPITFTGNVDYSAKLFFDYICQNFKINTNTDSIID
jgi:hypothetical protein